MLLPNWPHYRTTSDHVWRSTDATLRMMLHAHAHHEHSWPCMHTGTLQGWPHWHAAGYTAGHAHWHAARLVALMLNCFMALQCSVVPSTLHSAAASTSSPQPPLTLPRSVIAEQKTHGPSHGRTVRNNHCTFSRITSTSSSRRATDRRSSTLACIGLHRTAAQPRAELASVGPECLVSLMTLHVNASLSALFTSGLLRCASSAQEHKHCKVWQCGKQCCNALALTASSDNPPRTRRCKHPI
jgi:hypothetical protein